MAYVQIRVNYGKEFWAVYENAQVHIVRRMVGGLTVGFQLERMPAAWAIGCW